MRLSRSWRHADVRTDVCIVSVAMREGISVLIQRTRCTKFYLEREQRSVLQVGGSSGRSFPIRKGYCHANLSHRFFVVSSTSQLRPTRFRRMVNPLGIPLWWLSQLRWRKGCKLKSNHMLHERHYLSDTGLYCIFVLTSLEFVFSGHRDNN